MPEYPRPNPSPDHPANQPPPPLPCPFCGKPAGRVAEPPDVFYGCPDPKCAARGVLSDIAAWNTRAAVSTLPATILAVPAAPNPISDLQHICLAIMAVCAALILGVGLPAIALGLLARMLGLR